MTHTLLSHCLLASLLFFWRLRIQASLAPTGMSCLFAQVAEASMVLALDFVTSSLVECITGGGIELRDCTSSFAPVGDVIGVGEGLSAGLR